MLYLYILGREKCQIRGTNVTSTLSFKSIPHILIDLVEPGFVDISVYLKSRSTGSLISCVGESGASKVLTVLESIDSRLACDLTL